MAEIAKVVITDSFRRKIANAASRVSINDGSISDPNTGPSASHRSRHKAAIGGEVLVVANVDDRRRIRRADDAVQLVGCDFKK